MISFLASLPLWLSGLLVVGLPTVAMFGPVLVRRYVTLEKLEKNNEVAGFEFGSSRGSIRGVTCLRDHRRLGKVQRR